MVRADSPAEKAAAKKGEQASTEMHYDRSLATAPGDPKPDTGARIGTPQAPPRTEGPVPGSAALEPKDVAPKRGRAAVGLAILAGIIVVTLVMAFLFAWQEPDLIEGPVIEGPVVGEGVLAPSFD